MIIITFIFANHIGSVTNVMIDTLGIYGNAKRFLYVTDLLFAYVMTNTLTFVGEPAYRA